jgi:hypothetical protein
MDDLIQANLELHEELGKEVRINLENEAKIRRLEHQQRDRRYENYIQYLYGVIEKLESQRESDKKGIYSLKARLKSSKQLCDEKEKFILFRDNQLLKSEDIINNLKYKISFLSKSKMASSSRTRPALGTMSNTQLLNEIQGNATQLRMYSEGVKLPNVGVGAELATRIEQASLLIHNTLVDEITVARKALEECEMTGARVKATLLDRIQEAEASITKLEHGFEGLQD